MKARLPAGYGPQSQKQLLEKAAKMQEEMASMQASLEEKEYFATSGGGAIKATMNGKKELIKLEIDKEVVDPKDVEMLQDLVCAAVNEVIRNVEKDSSDQMSKLTSGMSIPGLF